MSSRLIPVGWILLGSAIAVLCWVSAARSGTTPERYGNDFTVFYAAARQAWLTGNPYEIPIRAATPYLYPPLLAQLLIPLAWLPLPVAAYFWAVGNVVAVAWLWQQLRRVLPSRPDQGWIYAGWWLTLGPIVLGNFLLGQVNLWIAAAVTFTLLTDAHQQRAMMGGLALAAAVSVKLSPVLLIPYFIGRRAWRLLGYFFLWIVIGNSLSFSALGVYRWDILYDWYREIILQGWHFDFAVASNQSLYGALLRLVRWCGARSQLPYWLVGLVVGGWLFLVGQAHRKDMGSSVYRAAAVASAGCVLGSQLSWVAHFATTALLAALLVRNQKHHPLTRVWLVMLAMCGWSSFQVVPSVLRMTVEAWSLFTLVGLGATLTLHLAAERDLPETIKTTV
ncbi:MAG: glycosyltransferase family 87 protein [Acidobacteriota bacterium]